MHWHIFVNIVSCRGVQIIFRLGPYQNLLYKIKMAPFLLILICSAILHGSDIHWISPLGTNFKNFLSILICKEKKKERSWVMTQYFQWVFNDVTDLLSKFDIRDYYQLFCQRMKRWKKTRKTLVIRFYNQFCIRTLAKIEEKMRTQAPSLKKN